MRECKLGELIELYDYKRVPLSATERASRKGEYPYYGAQGIIDSVDDYLFDGEYILIAEDGNNLRSRSEDIAQIAVGKFWVNNHAHIVKGKINNRLLAFLINKTNISPFVTGAAQPKLNQANLVQIPINLPDEASITKISIILNNLEAKIETNNKINANLEAQAQAIFKNWFVDFEPFKDKPFVDSELGRIPEGWRVGKLGELCTFKRGKNLLSKNAVAGNVPVVAGGMEPACYHNVSNTQSPVITISGSGANAGYMRMYHVPVWASDCSFIDSSCKHFFFVYCFLRVFDKLLKHAQTGAVQPHVKPSDIHDFDVIIPPYKLINDFQQIIEPFFVAKGQNDQESQRLSTLRDTLLPKLMSGEIEL